MHYFSINSEDNCHLGFLVLMADDEYAAEPQSGLFAIKAQADTAARQHCSAQWQALNRWMAHTHLLWQRHGDMVRLLDQEGDEIGHLHQQHLKLGGQYFVLQDLNGVM